MDCRRLAAVDREVSLWACSRTVQADVITHLPAEVGEPYIRVDMGPLLAEAYAGEPTKGLELLWHAGHRHSGKGG